MFIRKLSQLFYLSDIIEMKLSTNRCNSMSCTAPYGKLVVNGWPKSSEKAGIEITVFDYRSGLYEYMKEFDTLNDVGSLAALTSSLQALPSGKILSIASRGRVQLNLNAAQQLQKWGVQAGFTDAATRNENVTMVTIAYTGPGRQPWEKSLFDSQGNQVALQTIIRTYVDMDRKHQCSEELGLRTNRISDAKFIASKSIDSNHLPYKGRLHATGHRGWCSPPGLPELNHIQVDLGVAKFVAGVGIQAHPDAQVYVTSFRIKYSKDGIVWEIYKNPKGDIVTFTGLHAGNGFLVVNWFANIMARFVRIVPQTTVSPVNNVCIRFDLFGCTHNSAIFDVESMAKLTISPKQTHNKKLTVYTTVDQKSSAVFEVSSATDSTSLASTIEQFYISRLNGSIRKGNGEILKDSGELKVQKNDLKIIYSGSLTFNVPEANYYRLDIGLDVKVWLRIIRAKMP